jgi:hypothetical protein
MGSLASVFPDQEDVSVCTTSPNSTSLALQDPDDPRDETLRRYSYGVAMPAICCLGVLGKILNLVVLTRRNMKGIAYVYMRGKHLCVCVLLCRVQLCVQGDSTCLCEVAAYHSGASGYRSRLGCRWVSRYLRVGRSPCLRLEEGNRKVARVPRTLRDG